MDATIGNPSITLVVFGLIALMGAYRLVAYLNLERQRAALARGRGCQPAPKFPQQERIFGYDMYRKGMAEFRAFKILEWQAKRFHMMGSNTFSFVILGRKIHTTTEPENLKIIQAIDSKKWGVGKRRMETLGNFLGEGIFTSDGHQWAKSREMLRPNFVRAQVADIDMFESHVGRLIEALPKNGSTVDLADYFFKMTMDSATEFLFGESTGTLGEVVNKDLEDFPGAFARGQEYVSQLGRLGYFARFKPATPEYLKDRKYVWDVVDNCVKKALANQTKNAKASKDEKSGRYIFIDELMSQTSDTTRVRSELLNILLAGRDTTASLLTNVFLTLGQRPDIWEKLQAEVSTLRGERPTFEQLKNMKYLRVLMNESLRLHPLVPANSRTAIEDTVLPLGGGPDGKAPLFIKKGQVMAWSVYTMHRRKDFYGEDAEEFRPERWLDDPETGRKGLRVGWEYLPFNGGARICLGQQFALTEAGYTIARLCQAFSGIQSRDPEPWIENLTLTCVNRNGAKVSLTPRDE